MMCKLTQSTELAGVAKELYNYCRPSCQSYYSSLAVTFAASIEAKRNPGTYADGVRWFTDTSVTNRLWIALLIKDFPLYEESITPTTSPKLEEIGLSWHIDSVPLEKWHVWMLRC